MRYNQPNIIPISNTLYLLVEDWRYEWEYDSNISAEILVPAGFIYDGASIPRIFWSILGVTRDGVHRAASLVHDWIYTYDGRLPDGSVVRRIKMSDGSVKVLDTYDKWSRRDCDRFFKKMLLQTSLGWLKTQIIYIAVRCFGWIKWN